MTDHTTVLSNISQWLIELESGKHKQGKGYLLKDGAYCCLGVAADIVLKLDREPRSDGVMSFDGATDRLEDEHQNIGLQDPLGDPRNYGYSAALSTLNDNWNKSFPEIAAIIRVDLATNKHGYFFDWAYPAWQEMNKDGN